MRLLVACAVLMVAAVKCDVGEELRKGVTECKAEFGISDEDPNAPPIFDDPSKELCFRACIGRKIGRLAKEKLVIEKMREDLKNARIAEKEKQQLIECATKANELTRECEVYDAFIRCTEAYHKQRQSG